MQRVRVLSSHLTSAGPSADDEGDHFQPASSFSGPLPPVPPIVEATEQFSTAPVDFLQSCASAHPDVFSIRRGKTLTTVVVDPSLFDDILSDEETFNPDFSASMPTNHRVFQIPKSDLAAHEATAIKTLKVEASITCAACSAFA